MAGLLREGDDGQVGLVAVGQVSVRDGCGRGHGVVEGSGKEATLVG